MVDVPADSMVRIAVPDLVADLRAILAAPPNPDQANDLAELAGTLAELDGQLHWARDAALHAARRAGAQLTQLHETTNVPTSTLWQRHFAWRHREAQS